MAVYTIDEIRDRVRPVAEAHGVERVYLFGSYARGEAADGSDVDLRIDRGDIRSLLDLSGFHLDLCDSLGKEVSVVTTGGMKPKFRDTISTEEIKLYERT